MYVMCTTRIEMECMLTVFTLRKHMNWNSDFLFHCSDIHSISLFRVSLSPSLSASISICHGAICQNSHKPKTMTNWSQREWYLFSRTSHFHSLSGYAFNNALNQYAAVNKTIVSTFSMHACSVHSVWYILYVKIRVHLNLRSAHIWSRIRKPWRS